MECLQVSVIHCLTIAMVAEAGNVGRANYRSNVHIRMLVGCCYLLFKNGGGSSSSDGAVGKEQNIIPLGPAFMGNKAEKGFVELTNHTDGSYTPIVASELVCGTGRTEVGVWCVQPTPLMQTLFLLSRRKCNML